MQKLDGAIQMVTHLSNNTGVLRDTRFLEDNGRVMHVKLFLQLTDGCHVVINRYFVKSHLSSDELLDQTDASTVKR